MQCTDTFATVYRNSGTVSVLKILGSKTRRTDKDKRDFPKDGAREKQLIQQLQLDLKILFWEIEGLQWAKLLHIPFCRNDLNLIMKIHCEPAPFRDTAGGKSYTATQVNPLGMQVK